MSDIATSFADDEVEVIVISDSDDDAVQCLGVDHPTSDNVIIISSDDDDSDDAEDGNARSGSVNPHSRSTHFITDSEDDTCWEDSRDVRRAKSERRAAKYAKFYALRDPDQYHLSRAQLWTEWFELNGGGQHMDLDADFFKFCEEFVRPEFGGLKKPHKIVNSQNRRECGLQEETEDSEGPV